MKTLTLGNFGAFAQPQHRGLEPANIVSLRLCVEFLLKKLKKIGLGQDLSDHTRRNEKKSHTMKSRDRSHLVCAGSSPRLSAICHLLFRSRTLALCYLLFRPAGPGSIHG